MAGNREKKRFRVSESRSYEMPYEETIMSDLNETLSLEEAERRARRGADQLEEIINRIDKTPNKTDNERYAKLTSLLMSLLDTIPHVV